MKLDGIVLRVCTAQRILELFLYYECHPDRTDRTYWLHRGPFTEVAEQQLAATVDQLLLAYGVSDAAIWGPIISHLAEEAAGKLSPALAVAYGNLDPRFYIKVCCCLHPLQSGTVHGVCLPCSSRHEDCFVLLTCYSWSLRAPCASVCSRAPNEGPDRLACLRQTSNTRHAALGTGTSAFKCFPNRGLV